MSSFRSTSRLLLRVVAPAAFLFFVGCVNLDDIVELTKLADNAQQTLPLVVADIPATCQRQNHMLGNIPAEEKPPTLQAQDCTPYKDLAAHIIKDQNVLITYFDSLGKLASNKPLSYSKNIDADIKTISQMSQLSKNEIGASTAAQQIAKVLADAITKSYREHKVNSIIEQTDGAVQELTADLKKVITEDYTGLLSNEGAVLDIYYKSPMASAGKTERLGLLAAQRQYEEDTAALQARQAATADYAKVMDNLGALHAKLKQEAEKKASLREIGEQVGPMVSDLKDAISKLRTEHQSGQSIK